MIDGVKRGDGIATTIYGGIDARHHKHLDACAIPGAGVPGVSWEVFAQKTVFIPCGFDLHTTSELDAEPAYVSGWWELKGKGHAWLVRRSGNSKDVCPKEAAASWARRSGLDAETFVEIVGLVARGELELPRSKKNAN